jgi:molybdopterin-guanine dinucleotide biosynthesis protein A
MTVPIAGLILAGGRAIRFGGADKAMLRLDGRPLIEHVLGRFQPQVAGVAISANGDPTRFDDLGVPVLPDSLPGHLGPLAGILSGLAWVEQTMPDIAWMASVAVDTPLLPIDLVSRLYTAVADGKADMAYAQSLGRAHPVQSLWPVAAAAAVRHALVNDGVRSLLAWMDRVRTVAVEWEGVVWEGRATDPFHNVNTPADLRDLAVRQGGR